MDPEDMELVAAFKRGEESAFTALVIKYREGIYRLARRMLASHEDAADVAQDVFIRVYRALARFDGRAQLRTWLYRITVNLCLDQQERRKRSLHLDLDDVAGDLATEDAATQTEALAVRRSVAEAVAALPPRQRAMVVLRLYQQMTTKEIAAVMGCAEGTVKATIFAALRSLRKKLAPQLEITG